MSEDRYSEINSPYQTYPAALNAGLEWFNFRTPSTE